MSKKRYLYRITHRFSTLFKWKNESIFESNLWLQYRKHIQLTAVVLQVYEFLSLALNEEQSPEELDLREREK
jgi:hypothetical protein